MFTANFNIKPYHHRNVVSPGKVQNSSIVLFPVRQIKINKNVPENKVKSDRWDGVFTTTWNDKWQVDLSSLHISLLLRVDRLAINSCVYFRYPKPQTTQHIPNTLYKAVVMNMVLQLSSPWSNNSPVGPQVCVLLACFPSIPSESIQWFFSNVSDTPKGRNDGFLLYLTYMPKRRWTQPWGRPNLVLGGDPDNPGWKRKS